jgi:hypothetical protein
MDKYELGRLLGRGSFGTVYLVKRKSDAKKLVMKQINIRNVSEKERVSFDLEIKLLSQLVFLSIGLFLPFSLKFSASFCPLLLLFSNILVLSITLSIFSSTATRICVSLWAFATSVSLLFFSHLPFICSSYPSGRRFNHTLEESQRHQAT